MREIQILRIPFERRWTSSRAIFRASGNFLFSDAIARGQEVRRRSAVYRVCDARGDDVDNACVHRLDTRGARRASCICAEYTQSSYVYPMKRDVTLVAVR